MLRTLVVLLLLLLSMGVKAQEFLACPEYAGYEGVEFRFVDDALARQYGYQSFKATRTLANSLPAEGLAGKRAKYGTRGEKRDGDTISDWLYFPVLTEDCQRLWVEAISGIIAPDDGPSLHVEFIDMPPTEWVVTESVDRMTDAKKCSVEGKSRGMPFPMFHYQTGRGAEAFMVGGDFPGKAHSFRVDKKAPISEADGLSGARTQQLVAQIRAGGKRLLGSAYEWPYEVKQVREYNLGGLVEKLDHCKAWVRQ